jgi:hypothetical protein
MRAAGARMFPQSSLAVKTSLITRLERRQSSAKLCTVPTLDPNRRAERRKDEPESSRSEAWYAVELWVDRN